MGVDLNVAQKSANDSFFGQSQVALVISLGLGGGSFCLFGICVGRREIGASIFQVSLCLRQRAFQQRRINLSDNLPFFHMRVEIGKQLGDRSRNLRTHLHSGHSVDCACGIHYLANIAMINFCGVVLCRRLAVHRKRRKNADSCKEQENDQDVLSVQLHFCCCSP